MQWPAARIVTGIALAAALAFPGAPAMADAAPSAALSRGQATALDAIGNAALAKQHVPGFVLMIVSDGDIVYGKGFGYSDVAAHRSATPDTIFPIGSITKQFTAAIIERLASEGKLSIDALLSIYLPRGPHADQITVRDLLRQTSGLPNYTADTAYFPTIAHSAGVTPQDIMDWAGSKPLDFLPGTRFAYSNTNYIVLGALAEAVSGKTYAQLIKQYIVTPFGLRTLTFGPPPAGPVSRAYDPSQGAGPVEPWSPQSTYAAGGIYATAYDLIRWDALFFARLIIPQSLVDEMTTPDKLAGGAQSTYAFGWVVDTLDGRRQIWHNGGVVGGSARNAWFPDSNVGVVVLGNSETFDPAPVVRDAMRVVAPVPAAVLAAEQAAANAVAPGEDPAITAKAKIEYAAFQAGQVDFSHYDATMRAALTPAIIENVSGQLAADGAPSAFIFKGSHSFGAAGTVYVYRVPTPNAIVTMRISFAKDGKINGLYFVPEAN